MRVEEFDFALEESRIALKPAEPRDRSRLMVVSRHHHEVQHAVFADLPRFLQAGDVLVVNRTKVRPVRLYGRVGRKEVEVLLVSAVSPGVWRVWVRQSKHVRGKDKVEFPLGIEGRIDQDLTGEYRLRFEHPETADLLVSQFGQMPLPPYILKRRRQSLENGWRDHEWYQTVYAEEEGAIAAPTAGLHFTEAVLQQLNAAGVEIVSIVLHVGAGTFLPVRTASVEDHRLAPEWVRVSSEAAARLHQAKAEGRRIIGVGTTVVRSLETAARHGGTFEGETDLFIYPGFEFRVVDGLLTNFHLPKSTPLMLVSAFVGRERVMAWYAEALAQAYRWLSYGDAMLILP